MSAKRKPAPNVVPFPDVARRRELARARDEKRRELVKLYGRGGYRTVSVVLPTDHLDRLGIKHPPIAEAAEESTVELGRILSCFLAAYAEDQLGAWEVDDGWPV